MYMVSLKLEVKRYISILYMLYQIRNTYHQLSFPKKNENIQIILHIPLSNKNCVQRFRSFYIISSAMKNEHYNNRILMSNSARKNEHRFLDHSTYSLHGNKK